MTSDSKRNLLAWAAKAALNDYAENRGPLKAFKKAESELKAYDAAHPLPVTHHPDGHTFIEGDRMTGDEFVAKVLGTDSRDHA
jgi:hypothetical protein